MSFGPGHITGGRGMRQSEYRHWTSTVVAGSETTPIVLELSLNVA